MSYSFNVQAESKAKARVKIADAWDALLAQQPVHEADWDTAICTAYDMVSLMAEPEEGKLLSVTCNGWLSWSKPGEQPGEFSGASVGVSVEFVSKEVDAAQRGEAFMKALDD
jgi:hypothetical protein